MITAEVKCEIRPSEDSGKVEAAIRSIFPEGELIREDMCYFIHDAPVEHFCKLIRRQKILDAARSVFFAGKRRNTASVCLNKQVATVGKVSFADKNPVLGVF